MKQQSREQITTGQQSTEQASTKQARDTHGTDRNEANKPEANKHKARKQKRHGSHAARIAYVVHCVCSVSVRVADSRQKKWMS